MSSCVFSDQALVVELSLPDVLLHVFYLSLSKNPNHFIYVSSDLMSWVFFFFFAHHLPGRICRIEALQVHSRTSGCCHHVCQTWCVCVCVLLACNLCAGWSLMWHVGVDGLTVCVCACVFPCSPWHAIPLCMRLLACMHFCTCVQLNWVTFAWQQWFTCVCECVCVCVRVHIWMSCLNLFVFTLQTHYLKM